jgi:hypothetical protein
MSIAGTTATAVYVTFTLSSGRRVFLGSNGELLDSVDLLPAWVTLVTGSAHLTDSEKLYALSRGSGNDPDDAPDLGVVQTLHHITSNTGTPPTPGVFRYSIPAGTPSVTIPVRSAIQDHQEKADW